MTERITPEQCQPGFRPCPDCDGKGTHTYWEGPAWARKPVRSTRCGTCNGTRQVPVDEAA